MKNTSKKTLTACRCTGCKNPTNNCKGKNLDAKLSSNDTLDEDHKPVFKEHV